MEKVLRIEEPQISSNDSIEEHPPRKCVRLKQNLFVDFVPESKNWVKDVFPNAAIYRGYDELLWGYFIIAVYKDASSGKLNSLIVDKLGTTHYDAVNISRKSRFYPAIENLSAANRDSSVKKCIAVSLLQKYADLNPSMVPKLQPRMRYDYDPTSAGDLANSCQLIGFCPPESIGKSLDRLGFLSPHYAGSLLIDVVYEQEQSTIEANNELVFHLGDQLEQLFDPLTEYSPEQTEIIYKPPENGAPVKKDDHIASMVCNELLQVQTNFTLTLVDFLQKFLIPLRIEVANEEIPGLSIPKLNRLFPPTIDEVTRVNCIFLDALKASHAFGSQEMLKACSVTIPYFYKAYTRHDAATKDFSKQVKEFLAKFKDYLPSCELYSQMKMDTVVKSPQETILKIKLIIDRLWSTKNWELEDAQLAEARYSKICDIISSFGADERPLNSYSTRVFTPSGKLLTELARGWPTELQYNWLKRRVVGVFDVMDSNDNTQRSILVIFSDYIVILNVVDTSSYYDSYAGKKPLLSDILMNSLINEAPLPPRVPELRVANYFYIDDVVASTFGSDMIRIDHVEPNNVTAVAAKIVSSSHTGSEVVNLIAKAKILEKETAFHLFRYTDDDLQVFSTAHEIKAYAAEKIRSKFCLFLNMDQSVQVLNKFNLVAAFFASLGSDGTVSLLELTRNGEKKHFNVELQMLVGVLVSEIKVLYRQFYSTAQSPFLSELLEINSQLVKRVGRHFSEDLDIAPYVTEKNSSTSANPLTLSKSASHPTTSGLKSASKLEPDVLPTKELEKRTKKKPAGGETLKGKDKLTRQNTKKLGSASKQKRRSIIGKISDLFIKKKDRTSKDITLNSSKSASNQTTKKVPNGESKEENSPRPDAQRMSSIVHVPLSTKSASERSTKSASERTIVFSSDSSNNKAHNLSKPHPAAGRDPNTDSESLSSTNKNSDDEKISLPKNQRFYGLNKDERESKLFNHDLYGDAFKGGENENQYIAAESPIRRISIQEISSLPNELAEKELVPSIKSGPSKIKEATQSRSKAYTEDCENSMTSTENLVAETSGNDEDLRRKNIFPEIKRLAIGSGQFVRSPSFTEFFDNMRLVLDDNDEISNWKRLPNEATLNTQHKAREENAATHAFKSLLPFNKQVAAAEAPLSQVPQHNDKAPPTTKVDESGHCDAFKIQADEDLGAQRDVSQILDVIDFPPEQPSIGVKSPTGFKVVNQTSPKLVNINSKPTPALNERSTSQPIEQQKEFLIRATTPKDRHQSNSSPIFSNEVVADELQQQSHSQATSLGQKGDHIEAKTTNAGNTPAGHQQTSKIVPREQLLDDPEFSSFHMTFSENDETFDSSRYDHPSTMSQRVFLEQPPVDTAPIFYRLPAIERSTDTFFTCADGTTGKSGSTRNAYKNVEGEDPDDAMWISPSKLDIFDLSKQPDSFFAQINLGKKQRPTEEKQDSLSAYSSQEKALLPDSSYAYLRGLLVHDGRSEDENGAEDLEPTRLTFYK
ncbi:LAFA_0G14356g1_1 [Lachancea sp. 'fantastica']|nr:LAFA_0G14356g1_1 [Lachancea sp. 'fantastica']